MSAGRAARAWLWPAVLLLALSACAPDAGGRVSFVTRARERDAVTAAALVLLLVVAGRLGAYVVSDDEKRRLPPRPARLPALLVAAAVASQVTALLLLALVAGYVGYFLPAPGEDGAFLRLLVVVLTGAPVFVLAVVGAAALLVVARRVPQVGTAAFSAAVAMHAFGTAAGLGLAAAAARHHRPGGWVAGGSVLALVSAVGAAGYAYGLRVRARTARARR